MKTLILERSCDWSSEKILVSTVKNLVFSLKVLHEFTPSCPSLIAGAKINFVFVSTPLCVTSKDFMKF